MMSSKTLFPLLIVLALLFPVAPPPTTSAFADDPPAPPPLDPARIGVVVRDPWYEFGTNPRFPGQANQAAQDQMGQLLAAAGARWVRLEFIVELSAGDFQAQIARNDYFINEVAPRYGLQVLGLLAFRLVDVDPRDPSERGLISNQFLPESQTPYGGGVNQYMHNWLDRALWIMQRYQGRVAAYEVFNEPNRLAVVGGFRGGEGIAPERVATLHTKLYRCFKQNQCDHRSSDPTWRADVQLLIGGLHPRGSDLILGPTGPALSDRDYLRRMVISAAFRSYQTSFGRLPFDGIGYHPYPAEIVVTLANLDDEIERINQRLDEVRGELRTTLASLEPSAAEHPFWITELGYNAAYPGQSEAGQVAFLRAIFTTIATRPDVATLFWFKYEDFPPASGPNAQRWGLVHIPFSEGTAGATCPGGACYNPDGVPSQLRPSFWALRELAGLPMPQLWLPVVTR
ncbi:MAG: hypothetical protein AB4911_02790 [Oscillochloridaceae bacterium umkhey_bin13]